MKRWICTFVVVAGLVSGVSMASEAASTAETVQTDAFERGDTSLELGIVAGSTLQGVQLGVWNLFSSPLFLRGSAGIVFGLTLGAGADVGYTFDREGDFKQFAAVVGGTMVPVNFFGGSMSTSHIGAQYGVILWKVLTISAGASFFENVREGVLVTGVLPTGKIGVSFFF